MLKNIFKNIFIFIIILVLLTSTVIADNNNVIVVNGKNTIKNFFKECGIDSKNITSYHVDENYFISDNDIPVNSYMIREKSKKMAKQLANNYNTNNPFILFGFSQGGLRVRSMSQYIAKNKNNLKPLLKGVVTLDAPNYGSNLAKRGNVIGFTNKAYRNVSYSIFALGGANKLGLILGLSTNILSYEDENEWLKYNDNLKEFGENKLSSFLDKDIVKQAKELIENKNIMDNDKLIGVTTQTGLKVIGKLLNLNNNWFYQILNGALEYSSNAGANVVEVTKEFRPGSAFLNDLNSYSNVKNYEYNFKRVAIIGTDGNIRNVKTANDIIRSIAWLHTGMAALYTGIGVFFLHFFWTRGKGFYYLYKATTNLVALYNWLVFNKVCNYYVTGNSNNFNHDLLMTGDAQGLPYKRPKYKNMDLHIEVSELNHIVPDSGVDILIKRLRHKAKTNIENAFFNAKTFCFGQ